MYSELKEKLWAYVQINNPDLVVLLQEKLSVTQFLEDKLELTVPLREELLAAQKPLYIIDELCMKSMTQDLKPSRFNYLKTVVSEEFTDDYERLVASGVLTYEIINLIEVCKQTFDDFGFSEENEDLRFLRYAIINQIYEYLL